MIRIKSIDIEEFRGIRKLHLDFDCKNFAICGPNGTGKSGVVDAIEFCLTGDVTRLSGRGMAEISVKSHAPHVDQSKNPEKAKVSITAEIPSIKKTVSIHRSVKSPQAVSISPATTEIKHVIEELQKHPEFALSCREIAKYVITPPGQRSKDVQTLLRLDHIESLRSSLTSASNTCKRESDEAERNRELAERDLKIPLKLDKLSDELILQKVNEQRGVIGLEPLGCLSRDISFKTGVVTPKKTDGKEAIIKSVALGELSRLQQEVKNIEPLNLIKSRQNVEAILQAIEDNKQTLSAVQKYSFIKRGLELIGDNSCPLCDREWEADVLREYLKNKLSTAESTQEELKNILGDINAILKALSVRIQSIERTVAYCDKIKPPVDKAVLTTYLKNLQDYSKTLNNYLSDQSLISSALQAVKSLWWSPSTDQQLCIDACETAIKGLPDASPEDIAKEFLILAQERYEKYLTCLDKAQEKKNRKEIAASILSEYNNSCTTVLESIYDKVANDFSNYYRIINQEDEGDFVGKLKSAPAKLSFDVDFYGRGYFPPGAYHSEGHQDGMGLCLYLALMKHTLKEQFTFAVLDDVLMSVDTGHRREVCRLLGTEFPETQFIVTTHDGIWLQYMKTEGLIGRSESFGGWTVDAGPRVWHDTDIWTEIDSKLEKNDVATAAFLLRRYLEYASTILAHNLRSSVEFKGDGRYDLGDLMAPSLKAWEKRLEEGEKSAKYWEREIERQILVKKRENAKELVSRTQVAQWAINPSIHFNNWANFQATELRAVVSAFKELIEALRCMRCKTFLYLLPYNRKAEELRCNCGDVVINLKLGK